MSSLTTSQRQQRLTNVLLAGNLYKAHKIGKQLTQITALHKMSLGVSIANLKVNTQVLSSIRSLNQKMDQQEAEKRKIKLLKDIFFQISEEMEEIEEKKSYPLEKYFLFLSLKAEMEKNEINTSLSDDLSEKKMISSTIKNLSKNIDSLDKKFTKKEKDEQEQILGILEVDEESEINKLENTSNHAFTLFIKNYEKFIKDEFSNNSGEKKLTPNAGKFYFFITWRNNLDRTPSFYAYRFFKMFPKFDCRWTLDLNESSELFTRGSLGHVSLNDNIGDEIRSNIKKNLSKKQIQEINNVKTEPKKFYSFSTDYKNAIKGIDEKKILKEVDSTKPKKARDNLLKDEYLYKINKKIIDNFYNIVIKSIQNCFQDKQSNRLKEKETVKKLKGDIQKEKDLVKQIYKKHKFVEKILASRV